MFILFPIILAISLLTLLLKQIRTSVPSNLPSADSQNQSTLIQGYMVYHLLFQGNTCDAELKDDIYTNRENYKPLLSRGYGYITRGYIKLQIQSNNSPITTIQRVKRKAFAFTGIFILFCVIRSLVGFITVSSKAIVRSFTRNRTHGEQKQQIQSCSLTTPTFTIVTPLPDAVTIESCGLPTCSSTEEETIRDGLEATEIASTGRLKQVRWAGEEENASKHRPLLKRVYKIVRLDDLHIGSFRKEAQVIKELSSNEIAGKDSKKHIPRGHNSQIPEGNHRRFTSDSADLLRGRLSRASGKMAFVVHPDRGRHYISKRDP